jgi:hypothetical protein
MNIGPAALAASLNLKTADLLRVLSTNSTENGLLCESSNLHGILSIFVKYIFNIIEELHPPNILNRKRCRDDQSSGSSGQDEEDEDNLSNLSVEIPPHKHSNNSGDIAEDWFSGKEDSVKTSSFRGELKRPDLKGKKELNKF